MTVLLVPLKSLTESLREHNLLGRSPGFSKVLNPTFAISLFNLHLYNLSNVAYICLCYLPLPLKCQAKVLLSICGIKYLMGLITEHGLNHIVGDN